MSTPETIHAMSAPTDATHYRSRPGVPCSTPTAAIAYLDIQGTAQSRFARPYAFTGERLLVMMSELPARSLISS